MDRPPDNLIDVQWVAQCAHRLRKRWPHADVLTLEETAIELWRVDWLREMSGEQAATLWLEPLRRGLWRVNLDERRATIWMRTVSRRLDDARALIVAGVI